MVLVGEDHQPGGQAHRLVDSVERGAVDVRHPVVLFAMDDQHRRLEVLRVRRRVVALHAGGVVPGFAAEHLGETEGRHVRAVLRDEVVHASVVDEAGKAIGVARDPRRHVAAVTAAGRGHALRVEVGQLLQEKIRALQNILQRFVAPLAENALAEFFPETGRAVAIDPGDDITRRRHHVRVPAKAPAVAVHRVRTAVHELEQRVGFLRVT